MVTKKYLISFDVVEGSFNPSASWFQFAVTERMRNENISFKDRIKILEKSKLKIEEV